jgi:hypothetical protein
MNLLTVKTVAKLLRRGQPGRHFDGNGLYLVIKSRNNVGWERRYELNHKGMRSAWAPLCAPLP